jgi:hypothetical protein
MMQSRSKQRGKRRLEASGLLSPEPSLTSVAVDAVYISDPGFAYAPQGRLCKCVSMWETIEVHQPAVGVFTYENEPTLLQRGTAGLSCAGGEGEAMAPPLPNILGITLYDPVYGQVILEDNGNGTVGPKNHRACSVPVNDQHILAEVGDDSMTLDRRAGGIGARHGVF